MIGVLDLGLGSRSLDPIGHCGCSDFFHPAGTRLVQQQKNGRVNTRGIWITGPIAFVLSFRNAFFTDQQQSQCVEIHHGYLDGVRSLDTVIGAVTRYVFVPGKQPAAPRFDEKARLTLQLKWAFYAQRYAAKPVRNANGLGLK